jgi:hypothetical protein
VRRLWSYGLLLAGLAFAGAAFYKAGASLPNALDVQFAGTADQMRGRLRSVSDLRTHLGSDLAFLVPGRFQA